jgi:hypothetical protein
VRATVKLWHFLSASVVIAVLVILPRFVPLIVSFNGDVGAILLRNLALGVLWCALLAAAISSYRWRGLWLLVTVPLLLYWPIGFWLLERACRQNINACP